MSDTRYMVYSERKQWLATVVVGDDGLVTIYGHANGTYGHLWPGKMSFGDAGIRTFLMGVDERYAADKFTMFLRGAQKDEGQQFIREIWAPFVTLLRDELRRPVTHHIPHQRNVGHYATGTDMTDITILD